MAIEIGGSKRRIGLAMSGGGFRAAAFHLAARQRFEVQAQQRGGQNPAAAQQRFNIRRQFFRRIGLGEESVRATPQEQDLVGEIFADKQKDGYMGFERVGFEPPAYFK